MIVGACTRDRHIQYNINKQTRALKASHTNSSSAFFNDLPPALIAQAALLAKSACIAIAAVVMDQAATDQLAKTGLGLCRD